MNTGGNKIHRKFRPDRHAILNMRYTARQKIIRITASHPNIAQRAVLIHIIAFGLILPATAAHERSKEKFIKNLLYK